MFCTYKACKLLMSGASVSINPRLYRNVAFEVLFRKMSIPSTHAHEAWKTVRQPTSGAEHCTCINELEKGTLGKVKNTIRAFQISDDRWRTCYWDPSVLLLLLAHKSHELSPFWTLSGPWK